MADSRLDIGGDGNFGERGAISSRGELLLELGGVRRDPPRRTWQVGQILTKREISSFGTLVSDQYDVRMMRQYVLVGTAQIRLVWDNLEILPTTNRTVEPGRKSCLCRHVGTVDVPW